MKKILFLGIFLLGNIVLLFGQNAESDFEQSKRLFHEEKYSEAVLLLESMKEQTPKNTVDYAIILGSLGKNHSMMNNYSIAESYFLEEINILGKVLGKEHLYYANSLKKLGEFFYCNMKNYLKAEQYFLKSLSIYEKLFKESPIYVATLKDIGSLYTIMGEYAKAVEYLLEALLIDEKVIGKEDPDYATSLNNIGNLFTSMRDYVQAEKYYLEALLLREEILGKEHPDYATSLNNIGHLCTITDEYSRAEKYLFESLSIHEKKFEKKHPDYTATLEYIGFLYYKMSDYVQAEQYYLDALSVSDNEHGNYCNLLSDLGNLYRVMGDFVNAEKFLLNSMRIIEKTSGQEHRSYASMLINLGNLYNAKDDYEQAKKYYLEAKTKLEKNWRKEHPDYATTLNNLGNLYSNNRDYNNAEKYYLEAKTIWEKVYGREHSSYATSLNNIGNLYDKKHDFDNAEKYYLKAKTIWEKLYGKEHSSYTLQLENLETLYNTFGIYDKSETIISEVYKIKTTQVDRTFGFLSNRQRSLFWEQNKISFYVIFSFLYSHPTSSMTALAYNNTLFTKGLLLNTSIGIRDAIYASENSELIDQFEQLSDLHNQINHLQQKTDYNRERIETLQEQAEQLDKLITQSSQPYRDLKADMQINWQDVQKHLKTDEVAIEFIDFQLYNNEWTDSIIYAALVLRKDWETPKMVPLFEKKELDKWMAAGNSDSVRAEKRYKVYPCKQITKLIWSNLDEYINEGDHIYFSPSGVLHHLAIEYLSLEDNRRMNEKYNMYRLSSTKQICYEHPVQKYDNAVLYGGLTYDLSDTTMIAESRAYEQIRDKYAMRGFETNTETRADWKKLEGAKTEINNISKILTENNIRKTVFQGEKGNEESFRALSGQKTQIIHIATHGFFYSSHEAHKKDFFRSFNDDKPVIDNSMLRSGLILSGGNRAWRGEPVPDGVEDGVLTAQEILSLDLRGADLVVLSACETGLGDVTGEGVFGLQRAFKMAGAQTLIMSLWKVSDAATELMMSTFYDNLFSGKSKRESFFAAQAVVRAKYTEPYYWAAFILLD